MQNFGRKKGREKMYRMTDGCGNFIDASEDERVLIDNCNLRGSNRGHNNPCIDCPYSDQCNEFFS